MTSTNNPHDDSASSAVPVSIGSSRQDRTPHVQNDAFGGLRTIPVRVQPSGDFPDPEAVARYTWAARRKVRRKQLRTSVILFVLTFASTTLVGSDFLQLPLLRTFYDAEYAARELPKFARYFGEAPDWANSPATWMLAVTLRGFTYSVPLMAILLCHEMGHFLQAVRYRVPASFPYFIPLPIPPLGTMGAVILQGRGVANRKQMFDIAITGPLAGLIVTLPVLYYGITQAEVTLGAPMPGRLQFGRPLLVDWMAELVLGPMPENSNLIVNGWFFAGWVGIFITALNLIPVGQLDGGHIMYTLIGRKAHWIAMGVIAFGVGTMIYTSRISYVLLLVLLMLTGPRHPPTADDSVPLGRPRIVLGWLTLAFLIIGFTPQPIVVSEPPAEQIEQRQQFDPDRRVRPAAVDPDRLVWRDAMARDAFVQNRRG